MDGNDQLIPRSAKGFTLMEILIALVIISLGQLTLALTSLSVIQANSFANKMTQVTARAQDQLEAPQKTNLDSMQNGSVSLRPPDNISPDWRAARPQANLKKVALTATWTDSSGKTHSASFGSLIARR